MFQHGALSRYKQTGMRLFGQERVKTRRKRKLYPKYLSSVDAGDDDDDKLRLLEIIFSDHTKRILYLI